jgi:hypothetical protein
MGDDRAPGPAAPPEAAVALARRVQADATAANLIELGLPPQSRLRHSFAVDVLACPRCQGRMELLGLVKAQLITGSAN